MDFIWIWLLLIGSKVLSMLAPFTTRVGAMVDTLAVVAEVLFCGLCFFFAPAWWYGLIAGAIWLLAPFLVPKYDPAQLPQGYVAVSKVLSWIKPILVVLMYLLLFEVL